MSVGRRTCLVLLSVLGWGPVQILSADDWTNWRGPHFDGTVDPGNYPIEWSPKKNVAWSVGLPGKSGSTPVVWQDKLAMTVPIEGQNGVIAFDRSGKELWKVTLGAERAGKHKKGSGANSSPVADANRIYVYFKSGDFAAVDWSGKVLWHENLQKNYGEDTLWWDLGTSPVLTSKHVVVACVQSGPSYLAAFDPATGKEVWKVDRQLDAPEEAAQSYSTPIVTTYKGQEQIIVLGADHVTCHDAANGKELWRVGNLNPDRERYFRSIASPVMAGDIVIAPYARGKTVTAIRMGGSGDVTNSHVLWTKPLGADVPTPAVENGKVYLCSDKGSITCLAVETGEELWTEALEKNRTAYSSSPVIAGNFLYFIREDGRTFVIDLAEHKVKAENSLGENEYVLATPVFVDQEIFLRTFERLFCIQSAGKKVSQRK
ncbi:outer membrane protein assembly factor BamB family protein [Planctomicrobium piriforme]|uniref:Outer membrane protein assembly factor BamB, contains PQQ-like beta-propeller repeat n=1 Tax=Planctomicrobium piriforme TaxID=1576369 RepID=A0A1I3GZZ5_9PLAN|nr:PQQ-binding-like beta-propeller repeat protein [Planctomicrobium piriforme]SFI28961.1 Outer membrane protein assembly factor BamB, contains PQQ-like beta-propeller repeat [Planctomicrobium piriforme]